MKTPLPFATPSHDQSCGCWEALDRGAQTAFTRCSRSVRSGQIGCRSGDGLSEQLTSPPALSTTALESLGKQLPLPARMPVPATRQIGVRRVIGERAQELCETALSCLVVTQGRGECSITEGLRKTLAQRFARAGVIRETAVEPESSASRIRSTW